MAQSAGKVFPVLEGKVAIVTNGREAAFVKVDISKSDQVKHMVSFAVERFGRLDAAVNNAAHRRVDRAGRYGVHADVVPAVLHRGVGTVLHIDGGYTGAM